MYILNISNSSSGNNASQNVNCTFNMGDTQLFRNFRKKVVERNERMKALLQQLAEAIGTEEKRILLAEFSECQEAGERELEL